MSHSSRRLLGLFSCFLLTSLTVVGQDWVDGMQDPTVNFYTVQEQFESYWEGKEIEKGKGWKQFKRWEHFTEERVRPDGLRPDPAILMQAIQQSLAQQSTATQLGDWKPIGPFDGNSIGGIGRLNVVAFHPTNSQILFVGAPAGGLWKSVDNGLSWSTTTDQLTNLGVSTIAIDPTNPDHMFIGTGDRDGGDTYSHGLLESFDGGQTWNTTGLIHSVSSSIRITGLHLNPNNTQELVVATRSGMFRSTDGGNSWNNVTGGGFQSLHQKSGDPSILVATTYSPARVHRSTDGGATWTQLNATASGLPSAGRRMEIGTTPADPNTMYCLVAGTNNGFLGLYRSQDAGLTWTLRSSSPNLLGWSSTGSDTGGQGWYDLAIAVSPDDKDIIYTGGVNIWRSNNGGTSWSINAHWTGSGGADYVHADIHDLEFRPGTTQLYACSDGGLSMTSNGSTWNEYQNGMNITQYYRIGTSPADTVITLGGAQDNGSHRINSSGWDRIFGGDGMDCAVDPVNPSTLYVSLYYGDFFKSTNGGNSFNGNFNLSPAGNGNWVTPFAIDPNDGNTLYAGFDGLWKSTNGGVIFNNVSGSINGLNFDRIFVPKVNSQHVYVGIGTSIYKSTNGGQNFTNMSFAVPGSGTITGVAVAEDDQNHIWVTRSGYTAGDKVFESIDGGNSFTNISGSLPNVPANCVLALDTANNGVYVGTDIGVFYKDDRLSDWVPFMKGLPNVIVNELEYQPASNKIRAGTYGRGLWQSKPYQGDLLPPVASFNATTAVCSLSDTIFLTNTSINFPKRFKWTVTPTTLNYVGGTTDTSEVAKILVTQGGWYNIKLNVSNDNGTDSILELASFRAGALAAPFFEDFESADELKGWTVVNPDLNPNLGWRQVARVGKQGNPTKAAMIDLHTYSNNGSTGARDHLISPSIDLSTIQNSRLYFDFAYARRSVNSFDTLIVSVSTDCGNTWAEISRWNEGGAQPLATVAPNNSAFNPSSASDWCGSPGFAQCADLDFSNYDGVTNLQIRFTSVSRLGNRLYLDNINLTGAAATAPQVFFTSASNICSNYDLSLLNLSGGIIDSVHWSFPGGIPSTSSALNPTVRYPNPGSYSLKLVAFNSIGSDSLVLNSWVTANSNAIASIQLQTGSLCIGSDVTFTSSLLNEGQNPEFDWYVNGVSLGIQSSSAVLSGLQNGDAVFASLKSSEACAWPLIAYSDTVVIQLNQGPSVSATTIPALCISDGPTALAFGSPAGGVYSGPGVTNGILDPAQAGSGVKIMRYTLTDSNGCSASITRSVQISSKPILVINNARACMGDGVINLNWVSNPPGGQYVFNGNSVSSLDVSLLNPGVYSIDYVHTNTSCDSTFTFDFEVFANPAKPNLILSGVDTLTCTQSAVEYRWYLNGARIVGASGPQWVATTSGQYQVEVRDSSSCGSFSDSVNVEGIGLSEVLNTAWTIFPNPNSGRFTINTNEVIIGSLRVVDMNGKQITKRAVELLPGNHEFDLTLSTGLYMFILEYNESQEMQRVLIQ